ncbi:MAG: Cys-tRNA(Pro) deacylase [Lachnospiraceae bacterium]|nr:Cys-tRNA(Pro) deacylase [Robinsoniella sp.]MDY3766182.1 Cys-tRNA(Pro) deacylase [Lachnospiraceae bacterium]
MAKKKIEASVKTNAMRIVESAQVAFRTKEYEVDEEDLSGIHAAQMIGMPCEQVFKTLVLKGEKTGYFVCCIPVDMELDLKKVAKAVGDKKAEMIPMKDLLTVTGYIRGGCSPIGMKKKFPTYLEETAQLFDEIAVSAGKRGEQILIHPEDLRILVEGTYADLVRE